MASPQQPTDGVRDLLEEAETELSRRLREACEVEARGVSTESSAEIRRLEDSLLSAAMAAGRVRAARRHLATGASDVTAQSASAAEVRGGEAAESGPEESEPATAESTRDAVSEGTRVREFEDPTGRSWRAWPVTPGRARSAESSRRILGDYQEGWICFEALDNSGRRRLPRHEPRWSDLESHELQRLLDQAIDAPGRRQRQSGGTARPESRDIN